MSSSLTTAPTSIDVVALENYTTSSFGSRFNFYSVPSGSTIRTLSTQIDTTGKQYHQVVDYLVLQVGLKTL